MFGGPAAGGGEKGGVGALAGSGSGAENSLNGLSGNLSGNLSGGSLGGNSLSGLMDMGVVKSEADQLLDLIQDVEDGLLGISHDETDRLVLRT